MMLGNDRTCRILLAALLMLLGVALAGFFLTFSSVEEHTENLTLTEEQMESEVSSVSPDVLERSGDFISGTEAWARLSSEYGASFDELTRHYEELWIFGSEMPEDITSVDETLPLSCDLLPTFEEQRSVKGPPVLAIVVDDCGFSMEYARRLRDCNLRLTWAILPNLRFTQETAEMLRAQRIPFLIHMPMQAMVDPDAEAKEPNAYLIGVGMREQEVRNALAPLLDSLPGAYGINNHRGSKATSDPSLMRYVMQILRERDLFFMDSSTSSKTVAYKMARAYGLDTARNNYFLDNESDQEKIRVQVNRAIVGAKKRGSAVAICHLRPETLAFFESTDASYFTERGVRLVTLPELLELRAETD